MPRISFTNSAETDLLELWLTIAEENLVAADGLLVVRVLHHARDIDAEYFS